MKEELKEWKKQGKPWRLSSKRSRVIGHNNVNRILKRIAVWCKYDNPERNTAHGKRRHGLSDCANAGVAAGAMLQLGGHAHLSTSARYQTTDHNGADNVIKAKHGSP